MKKVAVFGNAGGGKSTLARQLAQHTGLPWHPLDKLQFLPGGKPVPHHEYLDAHQSLMTQEHWIIDGFGCIETLWPRLAEADTLIYLDLPLYRHALWVTKRLFKGLFSTPAGWPADSPVWRSTLTSYKMLWLCHTKLTPHYRKYIAKQPPDKTVYHLRSTSDIKRLLHMVQQ